MVGVVAAVAQVGPCGRFNRSVRARVNDVTTVATRGILHFAEDACYEMPVLGPAAGDEVADLVAHDDLLGPGPGVLLGKLVRRVDPELASVELSLGRVIEVVERPLGDQDVALRVDVRSHAEEDLCVVVHVHVGVDDDHGLGQREHPEPPDRVHHLLGMAGERLADRDDHAVVERARDREVVVDDLRQGHLDRRQEDPLGRLAEPGVLRRRLPDDDGRVDRVLSHRHSAQPEDRELLGRRVVARVVAERALCAHVVARNVPFEDDLGVRRYLEVDRLAAHELDRLAPQEPGEHELVDVVRERCARRVRRHRVEPDRDRHRDPPVLGGEQIRPPVLVHLPVHEGRPTVDHLHPVHADVADTRLRVLRDDGRKRDERRRVARPAALDREPAGGRRRRPRRRAPGRRPSKRPSGGSPRPTSA